MTESESLTHRLDRWLRRNEPYQSFQLTQAQIEKLLRLKKILVNGQKATAGTRVGDQDVVSLAPGFDLATWVPSDRPPAPEPKQAFSYTDEDRAFLESLILWEDESLCVLNKPAGLAVQGGTKTPYHLDGLLQFYGRGKPFRLVHRLDKETSGVFVVAKTLKKAMELANAFQQQQVQKKYWAFVEGIPQPPQGFIEAPLLKELGKGYEKVTVTSKGGKPARTDYRLIKAFAKRRQNVGKPVGAWLELAPYTGRMHQLRVHCAHIGHPIWGDAKYGATVKGPLCLHARQIRLPDGDTGRFLTFMAPLPTHMEEILQHHQVDWNKYA